MNKKQKQLLLSEKLDNFFDESYFDVQSISSSVLDESYFVKLVTKLAVSAATVWWTAIEIKDYIKLKKIDSKIEDSLDEFLSGKNSDFDISY